MTRRLTLAGLVLVLVLTGCCADRGVEQTGILAVFVGNGTVAPVELRILAVVGFLVWLVLLVRFVKRRRG